VNSCAASCQRLARNPDISAGRETGRGGDLPKRFLLRRYSRSIGLPLVIKDVQKRALLIINQKSRDGKSYLKRTKDALRDHGIETINPSCDSKEDLHSIILEFGPAVDMIIIAGGDGTLNAAAGAVRRVRRSMGIIPTGTANDLARTLHIPADVDKAIEIIADGNTRAIDLGSVNDKFFFNVASIGLSVELARSLTPDLKRRFGRLGYAFAALRVLARARPFRVQIECNDRNITTFSLQVAVGNGRYYGGGNLVSDEAAIDDSLLDLYSLEFAKAWRLLLMFWSFRQGKHIQQKDVRVLQGAEFVMRTKRPRRINADGEIVTQTPASFKVLPRAIEVFAPRR
jgi:diacylglycerol kinase (ATP)